MSAKAISESAAITVPPAKRVGKSGQSTPYLPRSLWITSVSILP
jgi:hypothetical protein